jgi:hypothetical protein
MKKKLLVALLICFAIVLTAAIASAASVYTDLINSQQMRIDKGVKTGQLTQQEAAILQDNLNHIQARWDKYNRNKINMNPAEAKGERSKIKHMLDRNDRMIRKMKNNAIQRVY